MIDNIVRAMNSLANRGIRADTLLISEETEEMITKEIPHPPYPKVGKWLHMERIFTPLPVAVAVVLDRKAVGKDALEVTNL